MVAENVRIGLIMYGRDVFVYELGGSELIKSHMIKGDTAVGSSATRMPHCFCRIRLPDWSYLLFPYLLSFYPSASLLQLSPAITTQPTVAAQ